MTYDVELVHGTYRTVVSVNAPADADSDQVIGKAKARARRDGFYCLPMAYESAKIIRTSGDE